MTPISKNHEEEFGIPTLEDLGLDTSCLGPDLFPGGETEALRRLDEHMKRTVDTPKGRHSFELWTNPQITKEIKIFNTLNCRVGFAALKNQRRPPTL